MILFHVFCIDFLIYLVSENTFLTFKDLKSLLGETGVTTMDVIPTLNCSLSDRFGKCYVCHWFWINKTH